MPESPVWILSRTGPGLDKSRDLLSTEVLWGRGRHREKFDRVTKNLHSDHLAEGLCGYLKFVP